jgi:hypothetical protein
VAIWIALAVSLTAAILAVHSVPTVISGLGHE